jgi:hypothetical protein
MTSNRRALRILAYTAVAVLAAAGCFWAAWRSINGPPYVLIITPADEGAAVQFIRPTGSAGKDLASPWFVIAGPVSSPSKTVLASAATEVPGGIIEFADTTITPGRFRVRLGGKVFDVMEARIVVDSIDHEWTPR